MLRSLRIAFVLLFVLALAGSVSAQEAPQGLRLPRIFGSNMVLQAGKSTPIWGWAASNSEVSVTLGSQTVTAKAGTDGKWKTALKDLAQSDKPVALTVKSGEQEITLTNVLIGDVWFGSGQSNMEFPVRDALEPEKNIAQANCPSIRIFKVRMDWNEKPQDDLSGGEWQVCTPETIRDFSAVLYYFGRAVQDKTRSPMGLVLSAVGGQRIEPFISREGFDMTPELMDISFNIAVLDKRKRQVTDDAVDKIDRIEEWLKQTKEARAANKQGPLFPVLYGWGDAQPPHRATMLFNPNIYPLTQFAIKGIVWYQGEGNEFETASYAIKMRALVNGWRKLWGNPDLPFYYVQIAGFFGPDDKPEGNTGIGYQNVRQGQLMALPTLGHAGMVVTSDISDGDLHPKDKQEMGQRLALWALKNEYGFKDIVPSGPLFKSMTIKGNKAYITFDHTEGGLIVGEKRPLEPLREIKDGTLKKFAIAGEDRVWHWADAKIEGTRVIVSCPDVPKPVAVRYAYTMNPNQGNLFNKAGLPASPFRTDDWNIGWGNYR